MEIERKFLIDKDSVIDFSRYPFCRIVQYYLSQDPEIRIRAMSPSTDKSESFYLTIKSAGTLAREETGIELNRAQFDRLKKCALAGAIKKKRYIIPAGQFLPEPDFKDLQIELDVFEENLTGLMLVEVEFGSVEQADRFTPPRWFGAEVTHDPKYKNRSLAFNGLQF